MRVNMIMSVAAAALCTMALPLEGQRSDEDWLERCRSNEHRDRDRERHCEVRIERLRSTGSLSVEGHRNGGVAVYGWDGDSVVVHARIQASARSESAARDIAGEVRIRIDGDRISADGPETNGRESWYVSFHIGVPRRTDLRLEVINGPMSVEDVNGRMSLSARNGPLTLDGVAGDVRARARNGPLAVYLTGSRWEGVGLDAETANGPATLSIPSRYSARLETGTTNGPMVIDYPMTLQGRIDRHITTTIGDGGPTVRVVTTNGPLRVRQR
ncbi:MAG TPA: hypothetical protein VK922_00160 [Gemmatimonadaceae bacterium]|nr:hypothetical protein [Gemmatimonadaceae bacterium]